jgi:hypothetical protein
MHKTLLSVVIVAVAGCGAGGAKYHVDDQSLATASVQEKQGVLAAQQEKEVAKTEQQKSDADLKNIDNDLSVAENEYKTAKLSLDTAKLNQKNAQTSGDVNRQSQSEHDVRVATLGVKSSDAKVDWLSKKRKWIKAQRDAADDHYAASDSRCELEKAKLAQQKGIKPSKDFDVMNFEQDNLKKQQSYSSSRMDADKMQADVDRLERDYQAQLQAYQAAQQAAH